LSEAFLADSSASNWAKQSSLLNASLKEIGSAAGAPAGLDGWAEGRAKATWPPA